MSHLTDDRVTLGHTDRGATAAGEPPQAVEEIDGIPFTLAAAPRGARPMVELLDEHQCTEPSCDFDEDVDRLVDPAAEVYHDREPMHWRPGDPIIRFGGVA